MILAKDVEIGTTVKLPLYKRTHKGITITNIKPGRLKNQIRLCYSNTSLDVDRNESVEVLDDPSN